MPKLLLPKNKEEKELFATICQAGKRKHQMIPAWKKCELKKLFVTVDGKLRYRKAIGTNLPNSHVLTWEKAEEMSKKLHFQAEGGHPGRDVIVKK